MILQVMYIVSYKGKILVYKTCLKRELNSKISNYIGVQCSILLNFLTNCMSFTIRVFLLACKAHATPSSKQPTKKSSAACCKAYNASLWNLISGMKFCAISRTSLWNGFFGIELYMNRVILCSLRRTLSAMVCW